jgi:YesN/AraC family two-component response regulator
LSGNECNTLDEEMNQDFTSNKNHGSAEVESIRIMLVDDHEEIRQALKNLLTLTKDIEVIGEATNGQESLEKAAELEPDIIIMDERMPGLNGLEASRILNQSGLPCKIIMLTSFVDFESKAFEYGVRAYLLKGTKFNVLTDCIRRVHQGETVPVYS